MDTFFGPSEQATTPAAPQRTFSALDSQLDSLFPTQTYFGRPTALGPNTAPDPLANPSSAAVPPSQFAQKQGDPLSCGKTSCAMSINMLTGKSMTDKTFGEKYGYNLYEGLVAETAKEGYKWNNYNTNFDPGKWDVIDKKVNLEGFPVMIGLNGAEFSPSGRGHIVTLIKTQGNEVTYLDPATGTARTTTRKAIEDAPPHPDGKFLFYPESGPIRKGAKTDQERLTVRARSDVIAQAHGLSPSITAAQWMQESGMRSVDADGNILTSSAGALGVSQMLPSTIEEVAKRHSLRPESFYTGGPTAQMKFGSLYMEDLLTEPGYAEITQGSYARALAAYNAGIGNLESFVKGNPVYDETKNYVANILTKSTGKTVSPDEAEQLIRSGGGPRYEDQPRQERFQNDKQNFFDYLGYFGNAMAGSYGSNATEDLVEGGREFASGLTFGLSELIPGFKPTGIWDNLRGTGLAGDLALEIPHFAGMAFITELMAGAVGARALGTTTRGTEATAPFLGFGPRLPNIKNPQLFELPWAQKYQSLYMNRIATAKGPMGTFGRLLLGRESQVVTDALAYGTIFGVQGATERFVQGMLTNEKTSDIVPEALSHGFQAAMIGTALGVGVPFVLSSAGVGLAQAGKAAPEMAAAFEASHPLFKGAVAAGGSAAAMSVLGMEDNGGILPASVGIAAALMSRGAPLEALGALAKSSGNKLVTSVIPEETRNNITQGFKTWFSGLEKYHQDLISGSFANSIGEEIGKMNTTQAKLRLAEQADAFQMRGANIHTETVQPFQKLVQETQTQEAGIVQRMQKAQAELQGIEGQLAGSKGLLRQWDDTVAEIDTMSTQIQKLRANPQDPSVPIPQGTDPAKYLSELTKQRGTAEKNLQYLQQQMPVLQYRDGLKRGISEMQQELQAFQATPGYKFAKEELPTVLKVSEAQSKQFLEQSDNIRNTSPGQTPRLARLENLDDLNALGRVDAAGRGIRQYIESPVRMAGDTLDFIAERNLRQLALDSPNANPAALAEKLEGEIRRFQPGTLLTKAPLSQKELRESPIRWKNVSPDNGGVTLDAPTVISQLIRQGDSRVAIDGAVDPTVQALRRELAQVNPRKAVKAYNRPVVAIGPDGKMKISDKDLTAIRTAMDLGQTKVPAVVHPTQTEDLRQMLRKEARARQVEVVKERRPQVKALKKLAKVQERGEVPGDELLSAIRNPTAENAKNILLLRATEKNKSTLQEEIQKWNQTPPDVRSQLQRDEITRLNDLWTANYSPSVLKENLFKEQLQDVLSDAEQSGITSLIRGAIDADNISTMAMAEEVVNLAAPIPWTEAKGYAQNVMVESMANGMNMGRYAGESALKIVDTQMDDAIKLITKDPAERDGLIRRFTNAVKDDAEMGRLLADHPEMAKPLAGYLQIRKMLDLSGHFTPSYKAAVEANEMLMSFPELINHARGLGWSDESFSFLKAAKERIKHHGSWARVEEAHNKAVQVLKDKGFSPERWHQLGEERQLKELYGDISKLKEVDRANAVADYRRLNTDLMLYTPIISPGQLVRNKIVALFSGDRTNVALKNLYQVGVKTGVPEEPVARMVHFAQQAAEGATDASAQAKVPRAMSRLRNSEPGVLGRLAGVKGNTEPTNYVTLENIVGKSGMEVKHPETGKLIPAKDVFLHPDAADFMGRYLSSSEISNIGKVWEDLNSIIRSSALMGSPSHHFMNIVTTQIANMITDPGKAMGLIPMGFKMLADKDGPALVMNAVRNGLNLRTMEQATRVVSRDIAGAFGEEMADKMYGTKQGLFRTLASAVNPMDPHSEMSFESLNWAGKAAVGIPRGFLKFDLAMNRKMLFDSIEAGMVSGFYHRTAKMAAKMEGQLEHLPPLARQRALYQAAADTTNMLNGAIPYWWHSDKLRKAVYGTVITPSWLMSKAQGFIAAMEPFLGITSANGRFSHLPEALRQRMYSDMQKTVMAGMAAFVGASQVMSYAINGHSTFEDPDPKKWFHVRVGETYYTSPLFGYFRDVSKMLIGSAGEQTVEPFFETMLKQLGPMQKVIVAEVQNKDPRTGKEIRGPGGTGVIRQIMDSMGYAANEFTNFEEIGGTTSSATIANLVGLGQDGPTKRLSGRQWLLRQFGVWDSEYEYPRVYRARLEDKIHFYSTRLDERVLGYIELALKTQDPAKRQEYMRQSAMIAFDEGIQVDNKQVSQILPQGRLRMTPDRYKRLITDRINPMGAALEGLNETDPVLLPLLQMVEQRKKLDYDRYMRSMSDPEYKV